MGFGQELKDFSAGFQAGAEIGGKVRDRWDKRRARDSDIEDIEGPDFGGGEVPRTSGTDDTKTGSTNKAAIAWDEADPYQRALLNTIAGTESAGDYNVIYGGSKFSDYKDHPRQDIRIEKGPNAGKTSSAAGKYQFLGSTWDRIAKAYHIEDFSPKNQDRAAWYLATEDYGARTGRDLHADLKSGDPKILAGIGKALNPTWTSLPSGIEQGQSEDQFVTTFNNFVKQAPEEKATDTAATGTDATTTGAIPAEDEMQASGKFVAPAGEKRQVYTPETAVTEESLGGMNPKLVKVIKRAQADNPGLFAYNPYTLAGKRSPEQQQEMVNKGYSKTLKSKHGEGKAADLVPINPNTGQPDPDYTPGYSAITNAMRKAAEQEGISDLKWGGDWKKFKDRPHWEVSQLEQQQLDAGGESPPVEQQVMPTMFAEEGGVIPDGTEYYQIGGMRQAPQFAQTKAAQMGARPQMPQRPMTAAGLGAAMGARPMPARPMPQMPAGMPTMQQKLAGNAAAMQRYGANPPTLAGARGVPATPRMPMAGGMPQRPLPPAGGMQQATAQKMQYAQLMRQRAAQQRAQQPTPGRPANPQGMPPQMAARINAAYQAQGNPIGGLAPNQSDVNPAMAQRMAGLGTALAGFEEGGAIPDGLYYAQGGRVLKFERGGSNYGFGSFGSFGSAGGRNSVPMFGGNQAGQRFGGQQFSGSDHNRGFQSFGDFFRAISQARPQQPVAPPPKPVVAAAAPGAGVSHIAAPPTRVGPAPPPLLNPRREAGGMVYQNFADGGQIQNPAATSDKYSPTRGYTQALPAGPGGTRPAGAAPGTSFVPRRVGQALPGGTKAGEWKTDAQGLTSSQQRFHAIQAEQKAAAAAAAKAKADAAAAASQPATQQYYKPTGAQWLALSMGASPQQAGISNEQWRSYQSTPLTVGNRGGGNPFAIFGSGMRAQSRGGSHYQGGMVQEFARGGRVKTSETPTGRKSKKEFDELVRRESRTTSSRAEEAGQGARDRVARRLNAQEGRRGSTAYRPYQDDDGYFTKPKGGGRGGGGKGGPGVDPGKTGSTGTRVSHPPNPKVGRKDPWSAAVGQTPNPYETEQDPWSAAVGQTPNPYETPEPEFLEDRETRFRESDIDPWTRAVGQTESPYDVPTAAIPEPEAPEIERVGGGVDRSEPALYAHKRREAERAQRLGHAARTRAWLRKKFPNAKIPGEEYEGLEDEMDVEPVEPADDSRLYEPSRDRFAYEEGGAIPDGYGYGFQEGGYVEEDEEEEEVAPRRPLSGRAEEAGYTTSAPGALRTPSERSPQPPESGAGAHAMAPAQARGRMHRPERENQEELKASPKLMQDVNTAVRGGAGFLQRFFGLDTGDDQGIETPESAQAKEEGIQRFASGEGAATQQEINDIDDKIDPDRRLSEGNRQMVRLAKTMTWYQEQGREDDAKQAAASLLQAGAQKFGKLGSLAGAAYRQYEQSGNPDDLNNTIRFLEQAYDMIPDGADMRVELNETTGKLEAWHTDAEGEEEKFEISARELPGFIRKTMDNSLYWDSVLNVADPGMARQKQSQRWQEGQKGEERKYERGEEERKHARDLEETLSEEEREATRKAEEETRKAEAEKTESDRRAERDRLIRDQEKLRDEALLRDREAKKKGEEGTFDADAFGPALEAATKARADLAANKDDPDALDAYNESLSRLIDAVGKDKQDLIGDYGFDVQSDNFVYKGASELLKREGDKPPPEYPNAKPGKDKQGRPIWVIEKDGKRYAVPTS